MRNFISEDDIEQAILQKLEGDPFQYGILRCDPSPDKRELLPDGTGRSSKKECVLPAYSAGGLGAPKSRYTRRKAGGDRPRPLPGFQRHGYDGHQLQVLQPDPQRHQNQPPPQRQRGF